MAPACCSDRPRRCCSVVLSRRARRTGGRFGGSSSSISSVTERRSAGTVLSRGHDDDSRSAIGSPQCAALDASLLTPSRCDRFMRWGSEHLKSFLCREKKNKKQPLYDHLSIDNSLTTLGHAARELAKECGRCALPLFCDRVLQLLNSGCPRLDSSGDVIPQVGE